LRDKLLALAALQKVDLDVAGLKKNAEAYPKEIGDLEKQLAAAKASVDAERTKLEDFEKQRLTLEQTITDDRDKVKKWEGRLTEQRSTREYAALAREIDIAKKGQQTMAEDVIELGRQSTIQRELVKQRDADFQVKAQGLIEKIAGLKEKLVVAEAAVTALDGARQSAASTVDASLIRRYDVVRKKRMPALVPVVAPGICQGCGMNIRAQFFNTLVASKGVESCPSCSRMIYAQEVLDAPASN
jgi:uncharacterized protein